MRVIKTHYDGKRVVLPDEARDLPPGEVILIFEDEHAADRALWAKAQEKSFAKAWDNEEDAAYDRL